MLLVLVKCHHCKLHRAITTMGGSGVFVLDDGRNTSCRMLGPAMVQLECDAATEQLAQLRAYVYGMSRIGTCIVARCS